MCSPMITHELQSRVDMQNAAIKRLDKQIKRCRHTMQYVAELMDRDFPQQAQRELHECIERERWTK